MPCWIRGCGSRKSRTGRDPARKGERNTSVWPSNRVDEGRRRRDGYLPWRDACQDRATKRTVGGHHRDACHDAPPEVRELDVVCARACASRDRALFLRVVVALPELRDTRRNTKSNISDERCDATATHEGKAASFQHFLSIETRSRGLDLPSDVTTPWPRRRVHLTATYR
jgi:hypothetical protein